MDPLSAMAGVGLAAADSFLGQRFALKNQHQAQDFSEQMYGKKYQMMVEDMKRAGLNPMLAYQHGAGGSPSSSAASSKGSNMASGFNETRIATAQEGSIRADTHLKEASTLKAHAETKNVDQDTLNKAGIPALIAAQVVQATASAAQANAMTQKIRSEIPQVEAQIRHIEQEIKKSRSDVQLNNALVEANSYLNGLRIAETYLTSTKNRVAEMEVDILSPKAKAAKAVTGELGAVADNIGKVGQAAWKFMFPTITGGH